jgi:hypothetical protein
MDSSRDTTNEIIYFSDELASDSRETRETRAYTLAQLLEREVANLPRRKDDD